MREESERNERRERRVGRMEGGIRGNDGRGELWRERDRDRETETATERERTQRKRERREIDRQTEDGRMRGMRDYSSAHS